MHLSRSRRIDATGKRILRACAGIVLILAYIAAPISNYAVEVKHQATGTIQSHTPSTIVLLKTIGKHQAQWDFELTRTTQIPSGVVKGVRVTIYYHDDNGKRVADRIKVLAVSGAK